MYSFGLLATLCLSPLALVAAQKDKQAYCDLGAKAPRAEDCLDIKDNGVADSDTEFYTREEWWSGNCRLRVGSGIIGQHHISGKELREAIQNILDTCDVGFEYVSGVRIAIDVCTLAYGGVETECRGPLQHVEGKVFKRDESSAYTRRHLTDVQTTPNTKILSRETELYGGRVVCGGGPAAAKISNCVGIGEKLFEENPKTLPFPYRAVDGGDCEVQIWPTSKEDDSFDSDHIRVRIQELTSACADPTDEIIGFASDFSGDMFGYHMFVGQFCGRLNSGFAGACFPGGK